jgi:hypothetical protein
LRNRNNHKIDYIIILKTYKSEEAVSPTVVRQKERKWKSRGVEEGRRGEGRRGGGEGRGGGRDETGSYLEWMRAIKGNAEQIDYFFFPFS